MRLPRITGLVLYVLLVVNAQQRDTITIPKIDGVTTATKKFRIVTGIVSTDFACITWNDYYNNGQTHKLNYGTTKTFGSSINLKSFVANTNITTKIPGLKSNTLYYAQFNRIYNGETANLDFSFTTRSSNVGIVGKSEGIGQQGWYGFRGRVFHLLPANGITGEKFSAYTTRGILVASVNGASANTVLDLSKAPPGLYLLQLEKAGVPIRVSSILLK